MTKPYESITWVVRMVLKTNWGHFHILGAHLTIPFTYPYPFQQNPKGYGVCKGMIWSTPTPTPKTLHPKPMSKPLPLSCPTNESAGPELSWFMGSIYSQAAVICHLRQSEIWDGLSQCMKNWLCQGCSGKPLEWQSCAFRWFSLIHDILVLV